MSPPSGVNTWKVRLRNLPPFVGGFFDEVVVHGDLRHTPGGNAFIEREDGALLVGAKGGWGLFWFADKFEIEEHCGRQR